MHDGPAPRTLFCPLGVSAGAYAASSILRSSVRRAGSIAAVLLATTILSTFTATQSHAITCSDRQQVCFRYCEKNYANAPRCRAVCGQLLSTCMSTGCWESKVTARQCGITKQ